MAVSASQQLMITRAGSGRPCSVGHVTLWDRHRVLKRNLQAETSLQTGN